MKLIWVEASKVGESGWYLIAHPTDRSAPPQLREAVVIGRELSIQPDGGADWRPIASCGWLFCGPIESPLVDDDTRKLTTDEVCLALATQAIAYGGEASCGDAGCVFNSFGPSGKTTNGGCQCFDAGGRDKARRRVVLAAMRLARETVKAAGGDP